MSEQIMRRLKEQTPYTNVLDGELMKEAAAEITRLRGQVEALNAERDRLWAEKLKTQGEIERLREEVERLKSEESCNDVLLEYAQAENERLREENARLRADNAWQAIETAPEDESVWLYGGWISTGDEAVANTGVVAWLDRGVWVVEEGETVVRRPTHWKRLPAPPADASTAIRETSK